MDNQTLINILHKCLRKKSKHTYKVFNGVSYMFSTDTAYDTNFLLQFSASQYYKKPCYRLYNFGPEKYILMIFDISNMITYRLDAKNLIISFEDEGNEIDIFDMTKNNNSEDIFSLHIMYPEIDLTLFSTENLKKLRNLLKKHKNTVTYISY